ncbi:hypothetical protein L0Z64_18730 (plasmid) [Phaeobacter sp. BS23]|uniref:hypothetical protein n=1 Tax=Phaeobacter sp. BS23 TaxID=2907239 RepID=UPI003869B17E
MNKFFAAFALATLAATTTASAQDEGTPTLLGGTGLEQGTLIVRRRCRCGHSGCDPERRRRNQHQHHHNQLIICDQTGGAGSQILR